MSIDQLTENLDTLIFNLQKRNVCVVFAHTGSTMGIQVSKRLKDGSRIRVDACFLFMGFTLEKIICRECWYIRRAAHAIDLLSVAAESRCKGK